MRRRTLTHLARAYRIGDAQGEFEIFSGEGAKQHPGRWNIAGEAIIYASEYYSTALLEKLVYTGEMPPNQHFVEIEIPAGVSCEVVTQDSLPDWSARTCAASRAFGSKWLTERRSAVLFVPSVVARLDRNVLINPDHPDTGRIKPGAERPVAWDARLFA